MARIQQIETKAKAWATRHVVAAVIIGAAVGLVLGLLIG
jgi:ElaB/YqjD/DUF883 family membrane-anchored ribosome-binding protein